MGDSPNQQVQAEVLHQLRLSLAVLNGYLQLLQREHRKLDLDGPRVTMFTDHMLTEAAQLARLLGRLDGLPPGGH